MSKYPQIWPSALAHLKVEQPDQPVLYFAPTVLQDTARAFIEGFSGAVTYAVKANDARAVIENLVAAGIGGFDVASLVEIAKVRAVSDAVDLHYNNPVRSRGEIAAAVAAGVVSYSVDDALELAKLVDLVPQGVEIAVRLRLPVEGAVYDFGTKFGADPEDAEALLRRVAEAGFVPAMTFHPGTQCADPAAWLAYIEVCADIARRAGVRIKRLNVGGGFASNRGIAPDLAAIFAAIDSAVGAAFGDAAPELVCEPGRALASEAFVLATQVRGVRAGGEVFLNDGVYGSFGEAINSVGVVDRVSTMTHAGAAHRGVLRDRLLYGPTCDSLDRLPGEFALPEDLAEGDFVLFEGMGAYSTATTTRFNGFGEVRVITVQSGAV